MSEEAPQTDDVREATAESLCTGGYHKGCRCPECKSVNKQRADAWRSKNRAKVRAQAARAYASYQSKTKAQATKKPGTRWTKEEITLALRDDLTLREIALQLGRSYSSVQKMRQHLRNPDATKAKRARPASAQEVTKHGVAGYSRGCRCDVCSEEKRKYQETPEARRSAIERQLSTRATAKRHRFQWTGPDLEVAARNDLTVKEIATLLGRSYSSVANMRHRLGVEPKIINLAGLAEGAGSVRPDEEQT